MKLKKVVVGALAAASLMLTACGGGGDGGYTVDGEKLNHAQLAKEFVFAVNHYMSDYDIELKKTHTLQRNYIVVYDYVYGTYDAYDLTGYVAGENIADFLYYNDAYFYYGLINEGNGYYYDPITGTRFNRSEVSLDSYIKKAVKEKAYKNHVAAAIKTGFGLSMNSAKDLAQAYIDMASMPSSQVSATFVDRVTQKAFGFSISKIESELAAGNSNAINEALSSASVSTGMPAEVLEAKIKQAFKIDLAEIKAAL